MMLAEHWRNLAETVVGGMLNGLVAGVIIAVCGWLLLRTLRSQSSSARFAVWLATLGAVVAFPMIHGAFCGPGSASVAHSALRWPASWAGWIFLAWVLAAAAGLAKITFGFSQLWTLRRSCAPLNTADLPLDLSATLATSRFHRRVRIWTSDKVRVPAAIGFIEPAIVIPTWALKDLTPAELNAVILHELAHLRRWDDWTNLAQKIVSALLFFHPAVWWIGRGLTREREMACDDFVLAATSDHRGYAQCLVSVAEKSFLRRGLALAQAMTERVQLTAQRVARILQSAGSPAKPDTTKVWKPAVVFVTAVSTMCIISLWHEPNLVAFEDSRSNTRSVVETAAHFDAQVVPATFISRSETGKGTTFSRAAQAAKPQGIPPARATRASVLSGAAHHQQSPVRVIDANAAGGVHSPGARTVLVIMRSDRVDAYGRTWSVSIWQLTVYHPDQNAGPQSRKGVPPKST